MTKSLEQSSRGWGEWIKRASRIDHVEDATFRGASSFRVRQILSALRNRTTVSREESDGSECNVWAPHHRRSLRVMPSTIQAQLGDMSCILLCTHCRCRNCIVRTIMMCLIWYPGVPPCAIWKPCTERHSRCGLCFMFESSAAAVKRETTPTPLLPVYLSIWSVIAGVFACTNCRALFPSWYEYSWDEGKGLFSEEGLLVEELGFW